MTLEEFNNIEIGASCYIPDNYNKGQFISVQILDKDNIFRKLKVMLNRKWLSYRYLQLNKSNKCRCIVGMITNYDYPKCQIYF